MRKIEIRDADWGIQRVYLDDVLVGQITHKGLFVNDPCELPEHEWSANELRLLAILVDEHKPK